MAKFSDRMGITTTPTELQVESMNDDLRNSLWNVLVKYFNCGGTGIFGCLYFSFFKEPVDTIPKTEAARKRTLRTTFMKFEWFDVYNLLEFIMINMVEFSMPWQTKKEFMEKLNYVLKRELSGYRVIKGEIVPITDKQEVESIRVAATESSFGLEGVSKHINKALHLLGKKPDPDYENSIKESISAVEAICCLLTKEKAKGLSKALNKLSDKMHLHPSLKSGFSKLYGYASNEDGIRHSILEEKDIGFAEAKYMLVTCSAFVNFVKDKARKEGLL